MSTQVISVGRGKYGIRLLSIDGGGIRGLSSLLILKEILYRVQHARGLPILPLPCKVFDLAGGTSTGGLIVILLFRLRMSIDDAIEAYVWLASSVFSKKKWFFQEGTFKASRLEEAIHTIIQEKTNLEVEVPRGVHLLDEEGPRCFVCALPAENMSRPILFRTWTPSTNTAHNPTIIEAVRATTATPRVFKVAEFGRPIKQRYLGVDLRWNNPVEFVVEQATSLYPGRPISCVVSLGTGTRRVIGYAKPDPFQKLLPSELIRVLREIAADCEYQSERMAQRLNQPGRPNSYFRLNVDEGLQGVSLDEWNRQGDVATHTMQYLNKHEIGQKLDQLVSMLKVDNSKPPNDLSPAELQAFLQLKSTIAISAYDDSLEQSTTSSECCPGTREDEIEKVVDWITGIDPDGYSKKPFLIVLGSAGSGKTTLLRSIARKCRDTKNLCHVASFFFSETDSTRNTLNRFINTIVYQISVALPELKPYVARAIKADPTILDRALDTRLDSLLLQPLAQLRSDHPFFSFRPCVVLIDALNECGTPKHALQVVESLTKVSVRRDAFPFLFLLSIRSDIEIENSVFCCTTQPLIHTRITLGQAGETEMKDIRTYVDKRFADIQNKHRFRQHLPPAGEWPAQSELQRIVELSGGQFLYVATVIDFIESSDEPHTSLRAVIDGLPIRSQTGPFVALHKIYDTLVSSVKPNYLKTALRILGIDLVKSHPRFWTPRSTDSFRFGGVIKEYFDSVKADIILAPLAPILTYKDGWIKFHHPLFVEFLFQHFPAMLDDGQSWIVSRLVLLFYDHPGTLDIEDVKHLIDEANPGKELHGAIDIGHQLAAGHPKRLPSIGAFNIWPFVTYAFFRQLQFQIDVEDMDKVFGLEGQSYLSLSVLIKLGTECGLSNTFFLLELCRTCGQLKKEKVIKELFDVNGANCLLLCMHYLAPFLVDRHHLRKDVLLPEHYLLATQRCLWYLQTSNRDVLSALKLNLRALEYLPSIFGIPNYLEKSSNNLTRGALDVLPILLSNTQSSTNDFLMALDQPFDAEVLSRNPSSSWRARKTIYTYLEQHGFKFQCDDTLLAASHIIEEESQPETHIFLHPKGSRLIPPWLY